MSKEIIVSAEAPKPIGPYSQVVFINGTLYVFGQIALDAFTGDLIDENITEEMHAVMKNIEAILRAAGLNFEDVVKCSIFIENMDEFSTINDAYGQYFKLSSPASEAVVDSRLPKNVNMEISCIAAKA